MKCPLLSRLGFALWIPGWVEEGWAHSEPAGLFLLKTSVLLIALFRCLKFLVQAHLRGLLQYQVGGEAASKPPAPLPREGAAWEISGEIVTSSSPLPQSSQDSGALSCRTIKIPKPSLSGPGLPCREVSCALISEAPFLFRFCGLADGSQGSVPTQSQPASPGRGQARSCPWCCFFFFAVTAPFILGFQSSWQAGTCSHTGGPVWLVAG